MKATFSAVAGASVLRPGWLAAQQTAANPLEAEASTIYLNPASGADTNSGAKASPLRTLAEAARRVNQSDKSGAMTIVLAEGIYPVGETMLLKPERRSFSETERLTIRAEVLPDDPDWNIGRMPALIHTMPVPPTWNGRTDPLGGRGERHADRDQHVTVQGLKILGLPVVETPQAGQKRRLYAIARFNRQLEDLEVAQCLFASDEVVAPNHVGVIAHGNGVVIHHCLFRGYMKDAVESSIACSPITETAPNTGSLTRNQAVDKTY